MEQLGTGETASEAETDLMPAAKKLRLESGVSGEGGLWGNKPVGIAQPFQMKESVDVDELAGLKPQQAAELKEEWKYDDFKPQQLLDLKVEWQSRGGKVRNEDAIKKGESGGDGFGEERQLKESSGGEKSGEREGRDTVGGTVHRLPRGKRYHLFVTHSTSDQPWAEDILSSVSSKWKVKACYQYMPNPSCYDDRSIKDVMKQSCVVLIGLSPNYLQSSRCVRERELAARLSCENIRVVLGSVSSCNRPPNLKHLLYLDFKTSEKRKNSMDKLFCTISETVQSMLTPRSSPASPLRNQPIKKLVTDTQNYSPDTPDFTSPCAGDMQSVEETVDKFEAMWGNMGNMFPEAQGSSREPSRDVSSREPSRDVSSREPSRDVSSRDAIETAWNFNRSQELEEEDSMEEEFGKLAALPDNQSTAESKETDQSEHQSSKVVAGDVEEGEVSDSSDELSKAEPQITTQDSLDSKSSDVAVFYDNLARPDADKRNESPIKLMRNFNNWVKSVLIRTYLRQCPEGSIALDICCGKGGDLLKWKEGRISHLVCADISPESIAAAKERYYSDKMSAGMRDRRPPFRADFYVTDCTEERLSALEPSRTFFHIASCQFSVHYSFVSYSKAHMMLRNACESLRPGGFFIGTTIDSDQLVHRLRSSGKSENGTVSIGNDIFTVTLDRTLDLACPLPLFGARYNFKLHGVVDLPEHLIYFPLLVKMLEDFDMEVVLKQNFYDFFSEHRYNSEDSDLLFRMEAFDKRTGTMSKAQWEAVGLYLVFVFRKRTHSHIYQ